MDKSMTGMVDRLINEAGLGGKQGNTGAYEKGLAKKVAEQVVAVYPTRDIKTVQGIFFSRRAVLQKRADKKALEAAEAPAEAAA